MGGMQFQVTRDNDPLLKVALTQNLREVVTENASLPGRLRLN